MNELLSSPLASDSDTSRGSRSKWEWLNTLAALIIAGIVGWFYAQVIDTQILGFTHDDGVYAVAAKSMATGHGFKLLHVIGHPAEIKYPFMYPILLMPIWLLLPRFPQNLMALNYVTIAFTMASCWLTYIYCRRCERFPGWLSILIVALVTSNFFFIYFFSTVMSEAPYLFFTLLTLWYFHRASQQNTPLTTRNIGILVVLSAITFLTRVPGITLMAAIGTWLLLNRQWKNALLYGIGSFILGVLPWTLWVKFNTPVVTPINFPIVNAYSNYGLEFIHNFKAGSYLSSVQSNFSSFLNHLLEDMFPLIPNFFKIYPFLQKSAILSLLKKIIGVLSTYALFGYFLLQTVSTLRKSVANKSFSPAPFTVPALYVFYYLVLIILWNYEDQMTRFITVVTPLLWMYFFKPLRPFLSAPFTNKSKAVAACLFIAVISLVSLWSTPNSYRVVQLSRSQHWVESGKYRWLWGDYKDSFTWIRNHIPANAGMGVTSDVVYYLYTERPTFYVFFASLPRANGRFLDIGIPRLMNSLDYYHVQYLVAEPHMQARTLTAPVNVVSLDLLQTFPSRFEHIYSSPHGAINIYKILPKNHPAAVNPKPLQFSKHLPPIKTAAERVPEKARPASTSR